MKVHFAYAVPPDPNRLRRWRNRVILGLQGHVPVPDPLWRSQYPYSRKSLSAPDSITEHVYRTLSMHLPTLLYDWREQVEPTLDPEDIFIGHPHPRQETVVRRTLESGKPCRLKALMLPVHHGLPEMNKQFTHLVHRADVVFGIMGKYWYDTLDGSELADWKDKITRLDMAIDTQHFPYLKRGFNPPGKRGYLYIGRNAAEKGTHLLMDAFRSLDDFPRGWIGSGPEIPGVPRVSDWRDLTPEFMAAMVAKFDFFVNFSISDANPTTILEAMAWGLPVACTRESGYYDVPSILPLSAANAEESLHTLRWLQVAAEDELWSLSRTNRRLVEKYYTWDRFTGTVWNTLTTAAGLRSDAATDVTRDHMHVV